VTGVEPAWPAWKAIAPQASSTCSESCCPRVVPSTCLSGSPAAASTGGQPPPTRLARRPMAWPPTARPRARGAPTARSSCRHRRRRLLAAGCQRRRRRSAAYPGRRPRCRQQRQGAVPRRQRPHRPRVVRRGGPQLRVGVHRLHPRRSTGNLLAVGVQPRDGRSGRRRQVRRRVPASARLMILLPSKGVNLVDLAPSSDDRDGASGRASFRRALVESELSDRRNR
jgi:hypothetical protein